MKNKINISKLNILLVFLLCSCQLNEEITELRDNIRDTLTLKSNTNEEYIIKEKTKESRAKEKKEKIENKKKPLTEVTKNKSYQIDKNIVDINKATNVNDQKFSDEELALLQPKLNKRQLEKFKKKKFDFMIPNKIGLLLPMSGPRANVGKYVTNSVRLKLKTTNSLDQKDFEIFDTQSTPNGARKALKRALSKGITFFIGPVFSDSTSSIKQLSKNHNVSIFSLSNDEGVKSKNIFVTGINIKHELNCLFKNLTSRNIKKLGIIQYQRNKSSNFKEIINALSPSIEKEFIIIPKDVDIDEKLRKISRFSERKYLLEKEKAKIKNSELSDETKKNKIKQLSILDTFGPVPFDALIINETGNKLLEIMSILAYYDINSSNTFIIGTSTWDSFQSYNENIFEETYFVSSKSEEKKTYDFEYQKNFAINANNLNYLTNDILDFLVLIGNDSDSLQTIKFDGLLGTTELMNSNHFSREIWLKKYLNGKIVDVQTCRDS